MRYVLAILLASIIPVVATGEVRAAMDGCVMRGQWLAPANRSVLSSDQVIGLMAERSVVLLGENHDNKEHHRWQLHTIAALHGRNPNIVLGFESFPRSVQAALDRWIEGNMTPERFLKESRWREVWRFDPDLYMPIFQFARMHAIPMVALNIEVKLASRVGREGWASIPENEREGVGDAAPPGKAYLDTLADIYAMHAAVGAAASPPSGTSGHPQSSPPPPPKIDRNDPRFRNFVDAQLLWDRAMAEKLAQVRRAGGNPLVIGIAGAGHVEYGRGIPAQLAAMGIVDAAVLIPWPESRNCAHMTDAEGLPVSDFVFGIKSPPVVAKPPRPRLGVVIEQGEDGVVVKRVIADSIAETIGINKGDVITAAAGRPVTTVRGLIDIIARQAPGTWLPLVVRRGDETRSVVAKFDPR